MTAAGARNLAVDSEGSNYSHRKAHVDLPEDPLDEVSHRIRMSEGSGPNHKESRDEEDSSEKIRLPLEHNTQPRPSPDAREAAHKAQLGRKDATIELIRTEWQ